MRTPKPTPAPAPGSAAEAPDVNIWLTSLGAWVHAQAEGNKVFEALVRDGLHLQRQTQSMAEASLSQATEQLAALTQRASTVHPTQVVDGLSSLFDTRVAKALERLGLPDAAAWQAMQARLAELEAQLAALRALVEVPVAAKSAKAAKAAKAAKPAKAAKSAKAARAPSAP